MDDLFWDALVWDTVADPGSLTGVVVFDCTDCGYTNEVDYQDTDLYNCENCGCLVQVR